MAAGQKTDKMSGQEDAEGRRLGSRRGRTKDGDEDKAGAVVAGYDDATQTEATLRGGRTASEGAEAEWPGLGYARGSRGKAGQGWVSLLDCRPPRAMMLLAGWPLFDERESRSKDGTTSGPGESERHGRRGKRAGVDDLVEDRRAMELPGQAEPEAEVEVEHLTTISAGP
ncbi:uncharacterized protein PSFLO_00282 [Pseudozyma flocculosa]|uniref:Uncharacterized protein n=1 Tax=Pseudozyma flocculosa TaxID=84751 RepID=A0A5C3EUR7_9BASI|nr:uncharacterized protein PSFLO_00282 [Pseudozyma flocculosa]